MKTALIFAAVVLTITAAAAVIAGHMPFRQLMSFAPAIFAAGLLLMLLSDYARRPRFRVRNIAARPARRKASSTVNTASLWTYTAGPA